MLAISAKQFTQHRLTAALHLLAQKSLSFLAVCCVVICTAPPHHEGRKASATVIDCIAKDALRRGDELVDGTTCSWIQSNDVWSILTMSEAQGGLQHHKHHLSDSSTEEAVSIERLTTTNIFGHPMGLPPDEKNTLLME